MMIKKIVTAGFSLLLGLMFCGCTNSMDSVINSYNGKFQIEQTKEEPPRPGDMGFDKDTMLDEYYLVVAKSDNTTFELAAPEARSYTWILTSDYVGIEESSEVEVKYFENLTRNTKNFAIRLSDSGLTIPGTYNLSLIVTDRGGTRYVDNCKIYIVLP